MERCYLCQRREKELSSLKVLNIKDPYASCSLDANRLILQTKASGTYQIEITNCPACGRKL